MPEKLATLLKAHKPRTEGGKACPLVLACEAKQDFLNRLKAVAQRAGLNPDHFWLHKFRGGAGLT